MTDSKIVGAPDTSLATIPRVGEALAALLTEARMAARWNGLSHASRSTHHKILRAFLDRGQPPDIAELSSQVLMDLGRRDLVHVRDGVIALAYPFSTHPTDFKVCVEGVDVHAVCAVDALGVSALAGRRSVVSCRCPVCRKSTLVTVADDGLTIDAASNHDARVWTGVMDVGGCVADSQCKSMQLFCSPDHLTRWRKDCSAARGFDLTLEEGAQLGASIFRPFLIDLEREAQE